MSRAVSVTDASLTSCSESVCENTTGHLRLGRSDGRGHPAHEQGLAWLKRVTRGRDKGLVAAHSLAEVYAILTTLPVHPPILPSDAQQLIKHNVTGRLEIVFLSDQDYIQVIEHLAALGIVGGATYTGGQSEYTRNRQGG